MIYRDPFTRQDFSRLNQTQGVCCSIYLPTSHVTQETGGDRIALKNLIDEAMAQAAEVADKRELSAIEHRLTDLLDDDGFWAHQANGLALLCTPQRLDSFRLAFQLDPLAEVGDRFHLKPLLAALSPQAAYVLAISQKSIRLYEFTPSRELVEIPVEGMPKNFSDATGRTLQRDTAPSGRLQGEEGKKVLQRQFLRSVERAMRPVLRHEYQSLILATTTELHAMYSEVNTYAHLEDEGYTGSVENLTDAELGEKLEPMVADLRNRRIEEWVGEFKQFKDSSRAVTYLPTIAKAATFGQVAKLLVQVDHLSYGTVDNDGKVALASGRGPQSYDVVDEIASRVIEHGGEVMAVRGNDTVDDAVRPLAAILRWA